ncbi:ACP phosphodiesterase [Gayadomonas joobiniege]|uniref:acyl carrier protein phosphodiesterase n=1 Tax=Gayadomonas joobiniege TaxID=1234606 RepID=UPI000377CB6C|nr:ACP phosphodiesterase [Gayadomonas joobiniege]
MNYVAHLYLAQPTPESYFGNLLGDFQRGVQINDLNNQVYLGLKNHLYVDRFTDQHAIVREAKFYFAPHRRRFAGIALDVLYDHFLIKHWQLYSEQKFVLFKRQSYVYLDSQLPQMPVTMQKVVESIVAHDWFASYESQDGVYRALDNISRRIRFKNKFAGSGEDIELHYKNFEQGFLQFFPNLKQAVADWGPEVKNASNLLIK